MDVGPPSPVPEGRQVLAFDRCASDRRVATGACPGLAGGRLGQGRPCALGVRYRQTRLPAGRHPRDNDAAAAADGRVPGREQLPADAAHQRHHRPPGQQHHQAADHEHAQRCTHPPRRR